MTLKTISDAVADETKGPRPDTIAENADPAAQSVLRLINRVGYRLMQKYPWTVLREEEVISTPGVETMVSAAAMPSDFNRFVPETMWDRDSNNLISGPVSSVEWNGLKVQQFSSQNRKFYYRGGAILTQPVMDAGVTVAFEYIKNTWATTTGGVPKAYMTIDTDVTLLDEELVISGAIYAWLDAEGQPSNSAFSRFKDMFDTLADLDQGGTPIMVAGDIFGENSRQFSGAPKASRASYGGDF